MRKDKRVKLEADVEPHQKRYVEKKAKKLKVKKSWIVRQLISNDMEHEKISL